MVAYQRNKRVVSNRWGVLFSFLLLASMATAQSSSIRGFIHDGTDQALESASLALFNSMDSSLTKIELSGVDGSILMEDIPEGSYYVHVMYTGYRTHETPNFKLTKGKTKDLGTVRMQAAINELSEVLVSSERPLVERKNDRTIVNVQESINASGGMASDLFQSLPGVSISGNREITIQGKSGVSIFVDDRPLSLPEDEALAYLQDLPASQIDFIEIIHNPSVEYDAVGSAGIINIKLYKEKRKGNRGNASLTLSQGKYTRGNAKLSYSQRTQGSSFSANLTSSGGDDYEIYNFERITGDRHTIGNSFGRFDFHSYTLNLGADFFLSKRSTIGFTSNLRTLDQLTKYQTTSELSTVDDDAPPTYFEALSDINIERDHIVTNIYYQQRLDEDRNLTFAADYGAYRLRAETDQPNTYLDENKAFIRSQDYFTDAPSDIRLLALKGDYKTSLWHGTLALGAKGSFVSSDNTFDFYTISDELRTIDTEQSSQFDYEEDVYATYFNYDQKLSNLLSIMLGLRMEHTESVGHLYSLYNNSERSDKRSYTDWFPSVSISYELNDHNQLALSYGKRLTRPAYKDLNPFTLRLDELYIEQGNPFLTPQYSQTVRLSFNHKEWLSSSLSYAHTKDLITDVSDQIIGLPNAEILTYINADQEKHLSLSASSSFSLKEGWDTYLNVVGYVKRVESAFTQGRHIDIQKYSVSASLSQTIELESIGTLEVTANYNSPYLWGATYIQGANGSLNIGFKRKILDGKIDLTLSGTDILKTRPWSLFSDEVSTFYNVSDGEFDNRRIQLVLQYSFGNGDVKARSSKSNLKAEQSRIN